MDKSPLAAEDPELYRRTVQLVTWVAEYLLRGLLLEQQHQHEEAQVKLLALRRSLRAVRHGQLE